MRNPQSQQSQFYKKFTQVCEAYKILSDAQMKRIYDKYGSYSLINGIPKGADKFDGYVNMGDHFKIFEAFFGTGNPFIEDAKHDSAVNPTELEKIAQKEKPEDIVVVLECELFEFYNGAVKEVSYARKEMLSSTPESMVAPVTFTMQVQPGYSESTQVVYKEMGNQSYGSKPSDLIVKFA
jgi:DnaJ-class molecular chaperone